MHFVISKKWHNIITFFSFHIHERNRNWNIFRNTRILHVAQFEYVRKNALFSTRKRYLHISRYETAADTLPAVSRLLLFITNSNHFPMMITSAEKENASNSSILETCPLFSNMAASSHGYATRLFLGRWIRWKNGHKKRW